MKVGLLGSLFCFTFLGVASVHAASLINEILITIVFYKTPSYS